MHDIQELKAAAGEGGYIDDPVAMEPYLREWRGRYRSTAAIVLLPASTQAVARVVSACAREQIALVPQGGNTGLCGGAVAEGAGPRALLSLRRLDRIREVNALGDFMIAEAGCVLAALQEAAAAVDRLFPLSLSAEGSCQIGGNLATDAGGLNVLRYGTARQQVLGLEVVLADGQVWDGLRTLRKNTAGYDLRNLFVGSEGTLGIITAAALRLYPRPKDTATAFVAIPGPGAAVSLLAFLRERLADDLSAYELVSGRALDLVVEHLPGVRRPFEVRHPAYVLLEISVHTAGQAHSVLEPALATALEEGMLLDAVVAQDDTQRGALWRMRHGISEAQRREGASIKHDISLPIERIAAFLEACEARLGALPYAARIVLFGHIGDGSLHYNLAQPRGMDAEEFLAQEHELNRVVFDLVDSHGGSFSAEHGVGLLRREELRRYLPAVEQDLMARIKRVLDPQGLLNPGKVL